MAKARMKNVKHSATNEKKAGLDSELMAAESEVPRRDNLVNEVADLELD